MSSTHDACAGSDESAVHSVIRRHTMALADAVLLVVRKDPSAEQVGAVVFSV
jgi:hypothetical protein